MIRSAARLLFRFALLWFIDALSIAFTAWLLPGVNLTPSNGSIWVTAAAAAFMLGIVNLLIRPIILLLALPLGFFVIFGVGFFVNAFAILITSALLPQLQVQGFGAAFLAGIIMAVINTLAVSLISIDDDDSFFQGLVERIAQRQKPESAGEEGRGLVMLEIDGCSYYHLKQAIEAGRMPNMKRMMDEQGYKVSRVDCGLPSQTSACQAAILFGDSYDIPAFRWYEKARGKTYVSGKDAGEINARYAKGNGLLRGGSSINNMMNGDAAKSLLTLADLKTGTPEEKKARARDIYLLMINPYFIMRTIVLVVADALVEVWQYYRDKQRDVQPRLNRIKHGYPFIRAACTVFMRDVAEYLVSLDIVRGAPAIYATWPGYDEVAHHTGPSTDAAFAVLAKYDRTIGRIADVIQRKGPRPYDLIVLSDHGQSFGPTFKQRYGFSLMDFIQRHLPEGSGVDHSTGGDDGTIALVAVGGELENLAGQDVGGKFATQVARGGQRALEAGVARDQKETSVTKGEGAAPAAVTVFGSGNLAPVYFHFSDNRVTRPELDAQYPGLFTALLEHEGVGVVMAYEGDGTPIAWGKTGSHNVQTGVVEGADPLTMYGDPAVRAEQLCRLADFPNNGDLTIFSTVYPDGTVAAMEELIGSHGGMGGVQTDAFLFHPAEVEVPAITNATGVFQVLDARRRAPVVPGPPQQVVRQDDFSVPNVAAGIRQVRVWLPLALRAIVLNPGAYAEVVRRPLMTGPALLIPLVIAVLVGFMQPGGFRLASTVDALFSFGLATGVVFLTGKVLTGKSRDEGRHQATYGGVVRALGFAQGVQVVQLLGLIPVLGNFAGILTTVLRILAVWMAAATAHDLRGWRAIAFPLVMFLVVVVSLLVTITLLQGAALSLTTLLQELGLAG